MELAKAQEKALELLEMHGLPDRGWAFAFNKNKRRLGVCKQDDKRIELSQHYVLRNSSEHVIDTVLHEIAHALVGTQHGHDDVWKAMCRQIGASPRSCSSTAEMPEGYWQARCPGCFANFARHRKPRRLRGRYCVACGPDRGQLIFKDTRHPAGPRKPAGAVATAARQSKTDNQPKQLLLKLLFN